MNTTSAILADQRVKAWYAREKAMREAEVVTGVEDLHPERSVITISREYGSGGHTLAKQIAYRLGPDWQIWDSQIVDAVAKNFNVRREMVEALDENYRTLIDRILQSAFSYYSISQENYNKALAEVIISIAHQGNKIIVGRGANYLLPEALNVRLTASVPYRTKAIESRDGLARADAVAKIRKVDAERASYIRHTFGRDIADNSAYDLVVCMDGIGMETVAAAIAAGLREHAVGPTTDISLRPAAELAISAK